MSMKEIFAAQAKCHPKKTVRIDNVTVECKPTCSPDLDAAGCVKYLGFKPEPCNNLNDFISMVHPNRTLGLVHQMVVRSMETQPTEKENNTMARVYDGGLEATQKNYLFDRVASAVSEKREDLRQTFGLKDDADPKTPKELVDRIMAGQIVLPENADKPDVWDFVSVRSMLIQIRWRDPKKLEDKVGYEAAARKLKDASKATDDIIMTSDAPTGLKAFQEFQAATFH